MKMAENSNVLNDPAAHPLEVSARLPVNPSSTASPENEGSTPRQETDSEGVYLEADEGETVRIFGC